MRRSRLVSRPVLLAATLIACGALSAAASVLIVTNTTDVVNGDVSNPDALRANPGPDGISLREAILAANSAAGPHTITFAAPLAGQSIPITAALFIIRNGVTLTGPAVQDGQPGITLDAAGLLEASRPGTFQPDLLSVYASDFTLTRLRFIRVRHRAIVVQAGETRGRVEAPSDIHDIRIEDNVFDNTGFSSDDPYVDAIRVWMDGLGVAVDATITNVTVARNTFIQYKSNGVIFTPAGTNCAIRNIVIDHNNFVGTMFPVELGTGPGPNNRLVGSRVTGNTIIDGIVQLFIGTVGATGLPPAFGNVIEDTIISGNVFRSSQFGGLEIDGGHTVGGSANATGNAVVNTQIINNRIVSSGGIHIIGGGPDATGNSVAGVRVINNTLVTRPTAGLRVDGNRGSGTDNSVSGVIVLNTVFLGPTANVSGPENEIAGEVTPDQVGFSLTKTPGFAGVNGNIAGDPRFVDAANGDFHLRPGSPAIDSGTSDGAPPRDLEDRPRFDDPATPNTGAGVIPYYDIGSFEYASVPAYRLTVNTVGTGKGTVTANPSGIACGSDCSALYYAGTAVTLTPAPSSGSVFGGWVGDRTCATVTMNADKTCIARFLPVRRPVLLPPRR